MKDQSLPDMAIPGAIAIVGLAGRFPGASSVEDFWASVRAGRDLIRPHPPETLADNFSDAERARDSYVPVRPSLPDVAMFDAPFFDMLPREAAQTDPQFRVFLECCWQALEDAGCDPRRAPGPVGVFGGASMSTYFLNNVLTDRARTEDFVSTYQLGDYHQFMGALTDTLATRVAFRLGLTGPAMTVATACSTSLVAVAQACQSLEAFQCDLALAGGVSITFPQERGYMYQEGGMVSRDGHCRPFDAEASGTVFGHGAGVVALRRMEDALADGDRIYALIRGWGLNNDGSDKISFTAPSVDGQAMAIAMAQGAAGVEPSSIGYVECHGTGTPLGDPVEFEGLKKAFADVAPGRVWLGSSKANVGHCDAAAGVVGLIKTTLSLRDRVVPPLANYTRPNPNIDLENSPFRIPVQEMSWDDAGPLRAGVSALGVGGTNAHVILEEAPRRQSGEADRPVVLPLSARTDLALKAQAEALAEALEAGDAPSLADAALTLQEGRAVFGRRAAVAAETRAEAVAALRGSLRAMDAAEEAPPVAFMFPGQGSQHPGMGQGLYAQEPVFSRIIDQGSEVLAPLLGLDLAQLIYRTPDAAAAARVLRDTAITQPALYLVEFATARLWAERGVTPQAMIGHSVGEFVAATMAGVMSFETGLKLIAARGRLMQDQPAGAMLSVRAPADAVLSMAPEGVDLAARNAPSLTVWAGPGEAVDAFARELETAGIACKRLHTSHAFHSAMMDPVVHALEAEARKHSFAAPELPYVSCVTGDWITTADATDPAYWARHCRAGVNFEAAVQTLCASGPAPILLEVGPGRTLGAFAGQAVDRKRRAVILQSLPDHGEADRDRHEMANAAGAMWSAGLAIDWAPYRVGAVGRVSLPGYQFERSRHWIEPPAPLARQSSQPLAAVPAAPTATTTSDRPAMQMPSRTETLTTRIFGLLEELSGESFDAGESGASFFDLGFDSLLLAQVSQRLGKEFGVSLTFRQLMKDYPSVEALVTYLDAELPPEAVPAPSAAPAAAPALNGVAPPAGQPAPGGVPASGELSALMASQTQALLALFDSQMRACGGTAAAGAAAPVIAGAPAPQPAKGRAPVAAGGDEGPSRYERGKGSATQTEFTEAQLGLIAEIAAEHDAKYPLSKERTQENRKRLADPRTASGFRREWKEIVYPVIAETSKGARLVDVDGNSYLDLVNGFGQTAFGHAPDFVTQAVAEQMARGFAIGPQTPLAYEVARKFLTVTGHERVTFCNTGSEAVMAAMRLARTVTGRDTIVSFNGDYHGQFDEVLVKGRKSGDPTALPAVAGVPAGSVANMVVLSYGSDASLDWIRENVGEIAAVLVEPVQSRRPDLRPRAFCEEIRRITAESGAALILDEIVTGFRVARGGIQELWGIEPDMATYGKVVGGGMPIGVLSGASRFLDALDGGHWAFGDESEPEVPPTFFAGTFVRHPLVLAAMSAVLDHIDGEGRALYERVAPRTGALLADMNDVLVARGLPRAVTGFSSWLIVNLSSLDPRAALLYPLMRLGGVHVHDGYPWFFTTAHEEADYLHVLEAFTAAVDRLQSVGILGGTARAVDVPITLPLTAPQKEVWMAAQLGDAASGVFIEGIGLRLEGQLDVGALERALNEVISRHDALRLRFAASGEAAEVMPRLRLSLIPEETDEAGLAAMIAEDARTPFDLTEGPLVRARLARLGPDRHVLNLTTHHIVCDGWSTYLILEELAALYNADRSGTTAVLCPPASFADYARTEGSRAPCDATHAYWSAEFPEAPELPDLPTDAPRIGRRSFAGATHVHCIEADLVRTLKRSAGREGVTLFGVLSGALAELLGRLSGAEEVTLAVPTAGQLLLPDDRLVGHCVNLLPIRLTRQHNADFADYLKGVATKVLDCFDHGDMTYGDILRAAGVTGGVDRQPLTEVQFNLDQQPDDFGFDALSGTVASNSRAYTNFDLIFNVTESPEGLRIDLTYATDILTEDTVARWCRQYHCLLVAIAEGMSLPVGAASLLSAEEAAALAALGNDTAAPMPEVARLETLISAQAAKTPEQIAVEDASGSLTYAELEHASDLLAAAIRERLPEAGARVAVMLDRSSLLVVALLAILKAGHAYVPLDPGHPEARNRLVLEAVTGLIHGGDIPASAEGLNLEMLPVSASARLPEGGLPPVASLPGDDAAAYVIFTSGSTGTPKGVEVPHSALLNFLASMAERPGITAGDVVLAVTTVSFDIAGLELLLPLTVGARTVIASEADVREAFPLVERLGRGDITMLQATPTLWQMLVEAGLKPDTGLKMLVGGEALPRDLADRLLALGGEVWNMYGPTETTIWSSCGRVDHGPITIGAPIANTVMHVLGETGELVPVGVPGELVIGGAGLAKGYFRRPDLTEAAYRMIDVPGAGPIRLYHTGDLARRNADGTIALLGRADGQVKLRGFRIELEEIEAAMRAVDGVSAAAAALRDSPAGPVLVGYYVARSGAPNAAVFAASLRQVLPEYMVPSRFQRIDALPLTGNGKLDRKRLPALEPLDAKAAVREIVAPGSELEQTILGIWQEVLGTGAIGVTDDIFDLGVNSLSIFRIAARMLDRDLGIEARHIMENPTIRGLAAYAETHANEPKAPSLKDFRRGARRQAEVSA
ncbi:amino acid adenylation domain-containing protein (plasmid) [Salipiger sp. H15]|uniref:Amino acid adenylation domain-containing protein n=1 Tax=Alloyangia sp. H15 TaxID=3029062 RepID=A0AAU8AUA2_9RHOB